MNLLHHIIAPLLSMAVLFVSRNVINSFMMGLFRDVGRIKSRNRRMKNSNAIASNWEILLKRDDPLEGVAFDEDNDSITTFTSAELFEFGNGKDGKPLLLSIFGRVYDVTAGAKFYGEGGNYNMFAGRDVTRALSTGCKKEECLVRDTDGLTEKQLAEGKRWLSFFQLHDKYAYVGNLEGDKEGWLDALIDTHLNEQAEEEAKEVYQDLDQDEKDTLIDS